MTKPLEGIRVLDLTQVLAGPFCCRLMGDMGADVIKVEQPGTGDPSRNFPPKYKDLESYYYLGLNGNKRSLTLNFREDSAKETFYDLVKTADVMVENYRPSVPPRLGIDYDTIHKINPKMVYCSISGFGHEGAPDPNRPAFDTTIQASGGVMSVIGQPGQPPSTMGSPVGDLAGAYAALSGILAALIDRDRNGEGRHVDIALLDTMLTLQAYIGQYYLLFGSEPGPLGSTHPTNVPVAALQCKDGRWVQIQFANQPLYMQLANKLAEMYPDEYQDLPNDPRFATPGDRLKHKAEIIEFLGGVFSKKTADEWDSELGNQMPVARINTIAESFAEQSVINRNMTPTVQHPTLGEYRIIGNPLKMGQEEEYKAAPGLGQHTDELLSELGYDGAKVQALKDSGAV
ncbi:MAG: CoA:oxalate CoA-transferase [Chloroflexi bacterium]|jgi:crotonobetainyl-CoA:carnitine CoA-transferase CaiB-like acyl-CoA transferase|nr:MAG: CoA:oxalate CoA-transferase [Chloroflexota bacterium]